MDIEWAKDGISGDLFIVQARPETVQSRKDVDVMQTFLGSSRAQLTMNSSASPSKSRSMKGDGSIELNSCESSRSFRLIRAGE